jgi:hypothetical protein
LAAKPYHQATIFATQCPTAGNLLKKRNASRFSILKTGFGSR